MDSKENRVKLITNPRSRRIEIAPISVPLEQPQQQRQHSIICAGSGLNYRSFREDESLASLESTILAGSLTINDRNCEEDEDKDDEEEEEDEYDGEYSNNSYRNTRRRSRAKDGLTTVMEVDENNNNPGAVNRNNQMNADRSLMESSSVLVEDENLLNVNIDAISASELPASASPMNDDVFFSPAKSSPLYKSPLDDDDNNDSAITGGSSNNDDDKSPAATATTCIEKNKDKFELRVYRDHATFGNKLSPIVSCPKHVSIAANTTTAKSEKQRSKQQQQQQPRAASRFVSISHVGGHGASSCCSSGSNSSSTFNYNTTSGDSGVGDERTGAYIQLIVEDFNKDVTKHAHSTPNEDEPACSTTEKQQQQEQSKSPAIVVTDASSSSSVRKSTKIPQLKMQSMANSSLYRRRVTRLTQHFEEVIKGKGQQPAKKELLVQPGKLGGAPSFVANKSVRSPSYQSREAQKLLRTSKNRSKISFALSPIKTKHHVNFTTARFNRTRPSSCSDCSSGAQDATSASFNACSTGGGSYNCLVTSCSDVTQSSSLCGSYTVNRRSHSASDATTPSSIEQSRLQRAIDNKCINVRRRQLTPYYVRPVLLNQQQQQQQPQPQQQQRTRLHANSPGNKTISKIVKRKSIGYVSSPIKAQVKPVKELRKMFSPSYNHTLAPKNEGLKKVRNLLEPNVPVISISKS